jgi:hypothetical protein
LVSRPPDPVPVAELELSASERKFLIAYADGGGLAEVGRRWAKLRGKKPYSTPEAASAVASRKLCEIRKRFAESGHPELFWESLGLDASTIARVLTEAMGADRFEPVMVRREKVVVLDNGQQRIVREDETRIVRVGPDHRSRIESAVRAASLRGELYASRRNSADPEEQQGSRINVVIRSFAGIVNNMQANPQPAALSAAQPTKEE